ncbi:unnamed protein product [Acanthoscelides obtectus]|uniref:Uncharacterized protein n=1 Tax=Acanthoscelides obtectus TaxID=200917 RepID=A0A9P0Q3V0_ACAOB|nr:unnamed protein product [Acanthoscelides obtectus]CAK1668705.1 hypothetical protein AOBTE_LOCUS26548 [Acanthoscelides obtectus]
MEEVEGDENGNVQESEEALDSTGLWYEDVKPMRVFGFDSSKSGPSLLQLPANVTNGADLIKTRTGRPKTSVLPETVEPGPSHQTSNQHRVVFQHYPEKIPAPEGYKRKTYFLRCKECWKNNSYQNCVVCNWQHTFQNELMYGLKLEFYYLNRNLQFIASLLIENHSFLLQGNAHPAVRVSFQNPFGCRCRMTTSYTDSYIRQIMCLY